MFDSDCDSDVSSKLVVDESFQENEDIVINNLSSTFKSNKNSKCDDGKINFI